MKELTTEQKAQRYDEAIERAMYWEKNPTVWSSDDICQKLFPELKESKESWDEKIRKALITYFSDEDESYDGIPYPSILAWLEKQGKPKWTEEDSLMIDKVIDYMRPMPIFFESTKGKSGKEYTKEFVKNAIKWLKFLKDRYTWKPSDEQMEALKYSTYCPNEQMSKVLFELYQDLKNL